MASSSHPRRPIRIAYDIARLSPGGLNGGIKTHLIGFLRYFAKSRRHLFNFSVFCREALVPELGFLADNPFNHVHIVGPRGDVDLREADGSLPPVRYWPTIPDGLLETLGCDLLYCGFGESDLYSPNVPQISLLVDTLHAERPEMLPPQEVQRRNQMYRDAIERSAFAQTNSLYCIASLQRHFDASAEKLFHVYLPLHGRFNEVEMPPPLRQLEGKRYFFYPANLWPHKNHETLLVAYRQYRQAVGDEAWLLALTGGDADSDRRAFLEQTRDALGLSTSVLFLEHLTEPQLKTTWELSAALVFPSLYEGFGLPLVEAMHFQKPIIAGRIGPIPELLEDRFTECDPTKPENLARAMIALTRSGVTHVDYSDLIPRFDLEKEADKLSKRFRSVVESSERIS